MKLPFNFYLSVGMIAGLILSLLGILIPNLLTVGVVILTVSFFAWAWVGLNLTERIPHD